MSFGGIQKKGLYIQIFIGMNKKNIVIICFLLIISLCGYFTISLSFLSIQEVSARCPNGYHKSPSGDWEKVTDTKGMPRCPNGYHRSPDGDCERVSKDDSSSSRRESIKLQKKVMILIMTTTILILQIQKIMMMIRIPINLMIH